MNEPLLREKAKNIRRLCVESSARTNSSHLGCSLSMADLMAYLFFEKMDSKEDNFILSKGHAAIGLYATLYEKETLSKEEYESYHANGSQLLAHPNHFVKGVEVSTGSLGHGPAIAAGMAWGKSMDGQAGTVYCLLGDGECQEGTVWEALIFISRNLFSNIVLIIDVNNYQGFSDSSDSLFAHEKMLLMLKGTGLDVREVDGHNFKDIHQALVDPLDKPRILFATTTKGKGVSYMENKFEWHYKSPNPEQLTQALEELK